MVLVKIFEHRPMFKPTSENLLETPQGEWKNHFRLIYIIIYRLYNIKDIF